MFYACLGSMRMHYSLDSGSHMESDSSPVRLGPPEDNLPQILMAQILERWPFWTSVLERGEI